MLTEFLILYRCVCTYPRTSFNYEDPNNPSLTGEDEHESFYMSGSQQTLQNELGNTYNVGIPEKGKRKKVSRKRENLKEPSEVLADTNNMVHGAEYQNYSPISGFHHSQPTFYNNNGGGAFNTPLLRDQQPIDYSSLPSTSSAPYLQYPDFQYNFTCQPSIDSTFMTSNLFDNSSYNTYPPPTLYEEPYQHSLATNSEYLRSKDATPLSFDPNEGLLDFDLSLLSPPSVPSSTSSTEQSFFDLPSSSMAEDLYPSFESSIREPTKLEVYESDRLSNRIHYRKQLVEDKYLTVFWEMNVAIKKIDENLQRVTILKGTNLKNEERKRLEEYENNFYQFKEKFANSTKSFVERFKSLVCEYHYELAFEDPVNITVPEYYEKLSEECKEEFKRVFASLIVEGGRKFELFQSVVGGLGPIHEWNKAFEDAFFGNK